MIQKLFSSFRTNLISGVLALAPFAAVFWILAWAWRKLQGLKNILPSSLDPRVILGIENRFYLWLIDWAETLLVLAALTIALAMVGLVSRNILGRRLIELITKFLNRIPVLSTVYSTLQQLLDTFGGGSKGRSFNKVVLIEYPRKGIYTLALVTGERNVNPSTGANERLLNIFVPTTPNPTSGFYLTIPATEAKELDMSVEDALKQIISMGIVQ
jgi:uncharacterized membrane protein